MQDGVCAVYDFQVERPTLGGAMILRQEVESRIDFQGYSRAALTIDHSQFVDFSMLSVVRSIFESSARCDFEMSPGGDDWDEWPIKSERSRVGFSYFSMSRVIRDFHQTGKYPRTHWSNHVQKRVSDVIHHLDSPIVSVHLRNMSGETLKDSNADGDVWGRCIKTNKSRAIFVLVGDDDIPAGVILDDRCVRARDLGLTVVEQMGLVSVSKGYVATASGFSTAAYFSDIPYVIFKHPEHHVSSMKDELGDSRAYPFALQNQLVVREVATFESVCAAIDLILS